MRDVTGKEAIDLRNKVGSGFFKLNQDRFQQAVKTKNEQLLADVITTNEAYLKAARGKALPRAQAEQMADGYRTNFYLQTKNLAKYRPIAQAQASQLMNLSAADMARLNEEAHKAFEEETSSLPDSIKQTDNFKQYAARMKESGPQQTAMKLNNIAWAYYENMTDPKELNQALTWSAKSLEYDRASMYLDTYAHLLSKLGRKAEAIKAQEEAIAKTKAAGQDATDYEKGLAEMKRK